MKFKITLINLIFVTSIKKGASVQSASDIMDEGPTTILIYYLWRIIVPTTALGSGCFQLFTGLIDIR